MPHDRTHEAPAFEGLLPSGMQKHIWLVTDNFLLCTTMPDGLSRTSQIRICYALRADADNLMVVQEQC
jgi:hypothetical protein